MTKAEVDQLRAAIPGIRHDVRDYRVAVDVADHPSLQLPKATQAQRKANKKSGFLGKHKDIATTSRRIVEQADARKRQQQEARGRKRRIQAAWLTNRPTEEQLTGFVFTGEKLLARAVFALLERFEREELRADLQLAPVAEIWEELPEVAAAAASGEEAAIVKLRLFDHALRTREMPADPNSREAVDLGAARTAVKTAIQAVPPLPEDQAELDAQVEAERAARAILAAYNEVQTGEHDATEDIEITAELGAAGHAQWSAERKAEHRRGVEKGVKELRNQIMALNEAVSGGPAPAPQPTPAPAAAAGNNEVVSQ